MDYDEPVQIAFRRVLCIRPSDEACQQREQWIAMLLASPVAARRAAQQARVEYWRQRVARLEQALRRAQRLAPRRPWLYADIERLRADLRVAQAALEAAEHDA
jgi:multidrug resistance efflux pump